MKITRISRMRDCRVFRDFTWSDDAGLYDFGRFNLIYGWNGSGKSTLSEIFRSLEIRQSPPAGDATLRIDRRDHHSTAFEAIPADMISIKVFNPDFVKAHVFRADREGMAPLLVVGQEPVNARLILDAKQAELAKMRAASETAVTQQDKLERQFTKHCQDAARAIKAVIGNDSGSAYRFYNAAGYKSRSYQMMADNDNDAHLLGDEDQIHLVDRQNEKQRQPLTLPEYQPVDVRTIAATTSQLLARTAQSNDQIGELLSDPSLSDWLRQGMHLHDDRAADACLYCEQPMPAARLAELHQHFNDEYDRLLDDLNSAIGQCRSALKEITTARSKLPVADQIYADLASRYGDAQLATLAYFDQAEAFLAQQISLLIEKTKALHRSVSPPSGDVDLDSHPLTQLIELVTEHNKACAAFQTQINAARERLEANFVAEQLSTYEQLTKEIGECRFTNERAIERAEVLEVDIRDLRQQTEDHGRAAQRLNDDLRRYLGPGHLRLAVEEDGYVLVRDGAPAHDPSDGEMNTIALLYFLQSLSSQDFELSDGVVVLDDPVSSLDENALHLAAGLIRARTKDAKQLFVLTHNFNFFRQVRDWFTSANRNAKDNSAGRPARFYMLRAAVKDDSRTSGLLPLDPLLENYQSDYHYLFSRIYAAANSPSSDMEDVYPLPNLTRRFLEAFLAFKLPGPQSLRDKLNGVDFDDVFKARIVSFTHTYSHDNVIDAPQHDLSELSEAPVVAQHVLDLVKQMDSTHYQLLEQITRRALAKTRR